MGRLEFELIELRPLSDTHYLCLGKYTLRYPESTSNGFFPLVWQKIDEKWKIISDHTSASVKKSTWKQHSDQLRRAMNSMKKPKMLSAGAGEAAMDSMPPPANTPVNQSLDTTTAANTVVEAPVEDYLTPCPHCSRRFNERAAERHIPQCLDIKARPKTLKKNSGRPAVSKSKAPLKTTTAVSRML